MALRIEDVNIVSGIVPVDLSSGAVDRGHAGKNLYANRGGNRRVAKRMR